MGLVMVFQKPVFKRHYAGARSMSNCVNVIIWLLVLLLPFICAYSSYSFWWKTNSYREQPQVQFKKQLMVFLQVSEPGNAYPRTLTWSTSNWANDMLEHTLRIPVLNTHDIDTNDDSHADSINIRLDVPMKVSERCHRVIVMALFQYRLTQLAQIQFDSLAFLDYNNALAGSRLSVDGDLRLRQREPIVISGGLQLPYSTEGEQLMSANYETSVAELLPTAVMQKYLTRNLTTLFDYSYPLWDTKSPHAGDSAGETFHLNMTVRVPVESVEYYTPVTELLKFAFVQYVPLYLLIKYLMNWLRKFLYEQQIFETEFLIDTPYGGQKVHEF